MRRYRPAMELTRLVGHLRPLRMFAPAATYWGAKQFRQWYLWRRLAIKDGIYLDDTLQRPLGSSR